MQGGYASHVCRHFLLQSPYGGEGCLVLPLFSMLQPLFSCRPVLQLSYASTCLACSWCVLPIGVVILLFLQLFSSSLAAFPRLLSTLPATAMLPILNTGKRGEIDD